MQKLKRIGHGVLGIEESVLVEGVEDGLVKRDGSFFVVFEGLSGDFVNEVEGIVSVKLKAIRGDCEE